MPQALLHYLKPGLFLEAFGVFWGSINPDKAIRVLFQKKEDPV